jgi:hypothetical protein
MVGLASFLSIKHFLDPASVYLSIGIRRRRLRESNATRYQDYVGQASRRYRSAFSARTSHQSLVTFLYLGALGVRDLFRSTSKLVRAYAGDRRDH